MENESLLKKCLCKAGLKLPASINRFYAEKLISLPGEHSEGHRCVPNLFVLFLHHRMDPA